MILNETPTEPGLTSPPEEPLPSAPGRVRAGRHGELEQHELIHLLDSIDTERERARFRESIYISVFVWIVIAWVIFYGPRYLWHQPPLRNPVDVMKERELTRLTLPTIPEHMNAAPKAAAAARPALDAKTLEKLRAMSKAAPAPAKLPETPQPVAAAPIPPPPPPVVPTPSPRTPPPVVADAPTPQPTRPNFGGTPSASDSMRSALNGAARNRGTGDTPSPVGGRNSPLNLGGAEILSDTQGVNFDAYLRRVLSDIKRNWLPLIPQETMPPLSKEGQAFIRFTILPDGSIGEMHLDGSTHDEAINRSCWGSITTEGQFQPLPSQFHGPNLELRIHYIVSHSPIEQ